jgi:hypothetical protein
VNSPFAETILNGSLLLAVKLGITPFFPLALVKALIAAAASAPRAKKSPS